MYQKTDRRSFLKQGIQGIAGLGLLGALGNGAFEAIAKAADLDAPAAKALGAKLALVRNQKVVVSPTEFDKQVINEMLNRSVCLLSGEKKPKDAWMKLVGAGKSDVVGLKVNNLGGKNCRTAPELVYAVAENLQSIGVKPSNIIIWDRGSKELADRGYIVNTTADGVRCFGTDPDSGLVEKTSVIGGKDIHLSKILAEDISILINMPIMKDHGGAGITGALKNHYGSFGKFEVMGCHGNNCDPYIADLNALPEIKEKTRLVIFDAMRPLFSGGPGDKPNNRWDYGAIYMSQDPVAADALSLQIIDAKRKEMGVDSIAESGRAKHIQTAANLGLGCREVGEITLIGDPIS